MEIEKARAKVNELVGNERKIDGVNSLAFHNGSVGFSPTEMYERTPQFDESLCDYLGVPYGFYDECSPTLRSGILNEFLGKNKKGLSLILRNDKADSLCATDAIFIPTIRVFDTLAPALNISDIEIEKDGSRIGMDLVSDRIRVEPRKGDITEAGIHLETGQYGGLNYRIGMESYLRRLVCSNGLIRKESERRVVFKKARSEEVALNLIEQTGRYLMNYNRDKYLLEYADTVNHPVNDPAQIIHAVAIEHRLSGKLERELIAKVPSLGENPTYYDVINLITQFANTSEKYRRRLQYVGGDIVRSLTVRCPHCHTTLK